MDKLQIIRLLLAGISLVCNVWLLVSIIRAEKKRKQYQKERDGELAAIRQSMSELESTLATAEQSLNAAEHILHDEMHPGVYPPACISIPVTIGGKLVETITVSKK